MNGQLRNIFKKLTLVALLLVNTGALVFSVVVLYGYLSGSGEDLECIEVERTFQGIDSTALDRAVSEITEERPARIKINSDPRGAKIYIRGYLKGLTPAEVLVVSESETGMHDITLIKEGYQPQKKAIALSGGQTRQMNVKLKEKEQ